jgi:PmbA protein
MELKDMLSYAIERLKKKGIDKIQGIIGESEKKELQVETGKKISLFRTTFQNYLNLYGIKDNKRSSISINKIDKESIDISIEKLVKNIKTSEIDESNSIADKQPYEEFTTPSLDPDIDTMYNRLDEFNDYVNQEHKTIILEAATLDHIKSNSHLMNSNGLDFLVNKGSYNCAAMFTAKDKSRTSSFNYSGYSASNLKLQIKDRAYLSELLHQSNEQLNITNLDNKFTGKILVTPHCLPDFLSFIEYSIGDGGIISGNSIYQDKVNKVIANKKFSLSSLPLSNKIDCGYSIDSDGYKAQNLDIIKDGVLKSLILSQYAAHKTNRARVSNDGGCHMVLKGTKSFQEMIKDIDHGILLCRFSGGSPSDNGDFSGVAKNSYYIENGEIKHPVSETMISGNIAQMFMNIGDISNETIDFGDEVLPWISFDGITVS